MYDVTLTLDRRMSIAKKGKRAISVYGHTFYWWVNGDWDSANGHTIQVTIVTDNKKTLVRYYLNDKDVCSFEVLHGQLVKNTLHQGCNNDCPKFGSSRNFTSKHIEELIKWFIINK